MYSQNRNFWGGGYVYVFAKNSSRPPFIMTPHLEIFQKLLKADN